MAALGEWPEDGAPARRHLSRHKAEPSAEVSALGEYVAPADRRDSCSRDDRANARHGRDAFVEMAPVRTEVLDHVDHAGRQLVRLGENNWHLGAQRPKSLAHRDAALEQKGADLVDHAGALANQSFTYSMKPLKIELFNRFDGDKLHSRTQHRLGNRFRITEVVLLPFRIRPDIPGRHQPRIVAKRLELPTQVMCPDARLHADETRCHVGEPSLDLAAR